MGTRIGMRGPFAFLPFFLVRRFLPRAMASGFEALRKRDRVTKATQTDIDSLTADHREAPTEDLELRDISDHKLRKVLRDLDRQVGELGNTHE